MSVLTLPRATGEGATTPPPSASFVWDRTPDADFVAAWRGIDPIHGERSAYSVPVWVAGVPDAPIQRWMLYELHPIDVVHEQVVDALRGPDVRAAYARGEVTMVSPVQQALYRATGRFGKPGWVVQGARGGHPLRYRAWERKLMRFAGQPQSPPVPGALSYAPLDGRVCGAVERHYGYVLDASALDQSRAKWGVADKAGERRVREGIVKFLGEQITRETGREIEKSLEVVGADRPIRDHDYAAKEEAAVEQFVTSAG